MIGFFVRHPNAANLLMAGILILGLAALPTFRRETFPDIPPERVEVRVVYPGASPESMEEAVCRRVEEVLEGINDLHEVICQAREGVAITTVKMREGGRFDQLLEDVKTEVEGITSFPEEVERPLVRPLDRVDFVASVAVTGPLSSRDLKAYGEAVRKRLLSHRELTQISVRGFSDHQIRIEIPTGLLRRYNLTIPQIADRIAKQSVDLPAGTIEVKSGEIGIRFDEERYTPQEFWDLLVLGGESGAEIRLGEIAHISERFENDENRVLFNGRRAAILDISKTRNQDTLLVMDALKKALSDERAMAPPGVTYTITKDVSSLVRDRLNMLIENGLLGLMLVFLVMWIFFSFRYAFWVAAGFPVAFLGTLFVMSALNYDLNMITMVALLIAVGLIMDDAIVIAENVAARREAGAGAYQAAIEGVSRVLPGVVSSFLTTVLVFGSLAFLKGHIGIVLKVLPVVLVITLAVSLIEAFLILPNHLAHAMAGSSRQPNPLRLWLNRLFEKMRNRFTEGIVAPAVNWRYLTLGLVISGLLTSISLVSGGSLKSRAFPDLEGDVMEARLLLPPGTPFSRTSGVVDHLISALKQVETNLNHETALIKNIAVHFNRNADANEEGPHLATVVVDLLAAESRGIRVERFLRLWREAVGQVPDVVSLKFTEPKIGPAGLPIDIRLLGGDLGELKAASREIQDWLAGYRGVHDLFDDLRPGKPEIRLHPRSGALSLGLTTSEIARQLRAAFQGTTIREIQVGSEAYEIDVRLTANDRDSLMDLDDFFVTTPDGGQVPLGVVARLERSQGYARIARINGLRSVTVRGDVDTGIANVAEVMGDFRERFLPELKKRHPGVRMAFEGEVKEGAGTGASMRRNFLIGLLGVYFLLAFQFRSYLQPVVVLAVIPMGLIGAFWGHYFLGLDLSMPSFMGLASLSGVVVNDSILLVIFIKDRLAKDREIPVADAAIQASKERFRAIFLTSLTTVAGLLPLLLETSLQAQVLIPLAVSLAFGLFSATMLALIMVPVLYTILDDWGLARRVESSPEEVHPDHATLDPS
ncbi:MAG: efflux RND transporter permease subunit [Magnetococcales bacterium]|nr:efflux RND transporter permease subunit [Magnetococcales bacterium]